ncbi:MAG: formate dehydrogenase subunit alpha [Candidatus Omnitrophota bacterium]
MKNVKVTVDGKCLEVPEGVTILSACESNRISIPTLCFLEGISEEASCSLCVVEVTGAKTLLRACVTRVTEGMEIFTGTPSVEEAQRINLELILGKHPLDCMTCEKDGGCQLQDLAYRFGIKTSRFLSPEYLFVKQEENPWSTNPFIQFTPEKCIQCGRCVNACKNQAVIESISFAGRGQKVRVTPPSSIPLEKTPCQFCGECLQACPTGALIEKTRLRQGKIKDFLPTNTICAYCGVGCNITIYRDKANRLVMAEGVTGDTVNNGRLCVKGRYGHEYSQSSDRLTTPLIKENGKFRTAGWEEAIRLTAAKLKEIKEKYGPEAIGVLGSSRCTNEDNYLLQKFARAVLGTNNIDNCARLCHASTVVGLGMAFGAGAATSSCEEIKDSDVIFLIGSNMTEAHPVIAQMVKEQQRKKQAKLVVCDPRYIDIAKEADLYLQQYPGTDVALINGIMKVILEQGLENKGFIQQHTEGYEEFKKESAGYDLEMVSKITGVKPELIKQAAEIYGRAKRAMLFYTMGITQHTTGVDNVLSTANLVLITGNVGKRGAGLMPLRGQGNVQGACDMGVLPDVFTGYQKVTDPDARHKFETEWGVPLPDKPGIPVTLFSEKALQGTLKAVYIMGENPLMTEPDVRHVKKGFEKLEFLAVQDIFLSETAQMADVVFPAASTYEKDGTFTNTERRVQFLRSAKEKPGHTKFDWEIVREVASAMGYRMEYTGSAEIMEEIARMTPSYAGISHERLKKGSLQWPCPDKDHPGTLFLHKDGYFKRPGGKGLLSPVAYKPAQELPDEEYPFILTTGRILYHYHSGQETRRVKVLDDFVPKNYVEVNPEDAAKTGIKDGDMVRVSTRRGSISLTARISDRPKPCVIFISFLFRETNVNLLTNPALDPLAKIPEYKVCAARIEVC